MTQGHEYQEADIMGVILEAGYHMPLIGEECSSPSSPAWNDKQIAILWLEGMWIKDNPIGMAEQQNRSLNAQHW